MARRPDRPHHRLRRHRQPAARRRHSHRDARVGRAAQRLRAGGLARLRRHDDGRRARRAGRRSVRPADGAARQHGRLRRDDAGRRDGRRAPRRSACCGCWPASASAARCPTPRRWPPSTCPPPAAHRRDLDDRLRAARRDAGRAARHPRAAAARLAHAVRRRRRGAYRRRRRAAMGAAGIAALPRAPAGTLARAGHACSRRMGHPVAADSRLRRFKRSIRRPRVASRRSSRPSSAATPSRCGARSSRACSASTWASAG